MTPASSSDEHTALATIFEVAHGPVIEHLFAPVPEPTTHVADVAAWLGVKQE